MGHSKIDNMIIKEVFSRSKVRAMELRMLTEAVDSILNELTEPVKNGKSFFARLLTSDISESESLFGSEKLTVKPRFNLFGQVLHKVAPRCLKDCISLERRHAFELTINIPENARVERRSL